MARGAGDTRAPGRQTEGRGVRARPGLRRAPPGVQSVSPRREPGKSLPRRSLRVHRQGLLMRRQRLVLG